ncbi:UDP-N-acetylglucosamine:LPS N-acetylglucosamine transferase [Scopulibacillus daqui]|uniref:UDP-N-acetylglucosamine:LPS N-acetylglucosamine transferase n=1 Tax=Scopulibacillus daqui TaxID=1469162 RepID=A0ABS2Q2M5_9BACL|nr:UDP-N-acetylglucosamine:LPS N-acetylglucosamine transferase [Scopulibacillus daqui]
MKTILLTGGGSTGHVSVNVALIPLLHKNGWEIYYIGSKYGIEHEIIKKIPFVKYFSISTGKLRRYFSLENFKDPFKVLKGSLESYKIIQKIKPDIIFSKGGFVSVPVILAGRLKKIPIIIHESDITLGLANKISVPFSTKICTTFPDTLKFLPKNKGIHLGAIVREEIKRGSKDKGLVPLLEK